MPTTLPTPTDFSFLATVQSHGWYRLQPFYWQEETETLERVERLDTGEVVLLSLQEEEQGIRVTVEPEGSEREVIARVRRMLQLDLSMTEFSAFCLSDPKLAHIPAKKQGRLLRSPTLWEDCCKVILTTNTTWTQTKLMVQRVVQSYGSSLPSDPARHAFPTPEQIAAVSLEEFSATAKLGYRNAAVHSLARDIIEGRTDLDSLEEDTIPTPDLWKKLLSLRGIGSYAASCLLIYLGRYERVNVDSWARMMVSKELGHPVIDKEVHDFFEPYGPWRALVYHFYPWKGEEPPY